MIKKLKYQGGATRLICRKQAELNKQAFGKNTSSPEDELILKANILDFDIISFSGISNYEDQILSIYSLLYYAGKPFKWTIFRTNRTPRPIRMYLKGSLILLR